MKTIKSINSVRLMKQLLRCKKLTDVEKEIILKQYLDHDIDDDSIIEKIKEYK